MRHIFETGAFEVGIVDANLKKSSFETYQGFADRNVFIKCSVLNRLQSYYHEPPCKLARLLLNLCPEKVRSNERRVGHTGVLHIVDQVNHDMVDADLTKIIPTLGGLQIIIPCENYCNVCE